MTRNREAVLVRNLMIQQQNSVKQMQELHRRLLAEGYELSPLGDYVKTEENKK